MLSIDTNILFHAFAEDRPEHVKAKDWISKWIDSSDVVISEFVLVEFYGLLRNPAVLRKPLSASDAYHVVQCYRTHPYWRLVGFPNRSQEIHDQLYLLMSKSGVAFRRIYDVRTALTLRAFGVTEFATCNVKDFEGFGFTKNWNPLLT